MATQTEHAKALSDISDQLTKGINEVVTAVGNSGNTTPEVDAAVDRLRGIAQQLDDLNPDAPTAERSKPTR